ncbi:nascent polypeptide-associated complex subunit alpha, muscle-specific form-like isoform X2 [Thrips palmi]|uniref:Nascent polypeptide-associated complex subunit alpha, muscle-specific form-like isoform X2 n=1 Tax=Thrips palmi TaxID=161013 RepID=A0A6P8Z671_THRPL|nr:nascent polypeptide-associated complex subunit alpha, muscle-specific form-like isoform X2 [Thrips palmi]
MFTTEPSAVAAGDSPRKPIAAVLFPRESPEPLPEVTSASPPKKTPEHLPEVTPALLPKMPAPLPEVTSPPLPRKTPAPLSEVTSPPLPKKAPAPLPEVRPAPLVKPAVPAALEAPAPGPSSTTPAIEGIQEAAPFQPSLPARKVTKKPPKAAETRTKTPMVSSPPAVAKAAPAAPRAKGSRRLFSSSAAPESYLKFLSKLPASKMHFTIPAVKDAAPPPPPPPPPPKPTEEATSRESTRQFFQRQVQLQDQAPFSAPETQIQEPVTRLEDPAGALESKTQRPVSRPEGPSSASELQIQEQGSSSSPEPQIQEQGSSSSPEPQIQEQAVLIQATASVPDPPIHDRAMLIESTPSVLEPQIREQAMVVEATASAPESQTQDQAMLFEAPESAPVPQIQDQAMQIESTVSAPEPQIRDQAMQIEVPGNAFAPPEQVQGVDEDPNVPSAAPGDSADHSSQSSERVAAAEEKPAAAQLQAPSKPSMERMFSNDSDASSLPATQAVDASQAESRDLEAAYVLPDISLDTGLSLSTVCGTMGLDSELAAPTLPRALEEADVDPIPPPPPSLAVHHDLAVVGVAEEHACSGPAEEGTVSGVQLPPPPRDTAGKGDGVLKFAKDVEAVTNASRLVTWLSTVVPEKDPVATSPPRLPQATLVARPVLVDAAPVDDLQSAPTPRREPESGMSECPSLPCSPPGPAQNAAPADPGASMDDTLDLQSMPTPKFDLASGVPKCPSLTCSPPGAEGIPSVLASLGLGRRNLVPMLASPGCSFPAATSVIAPGTSNTATPLADDQDADEDPLRDADESISYSPLSSSVDDESPRPLVIDCSPWTTRPPLPREQAAALQGGEEAAVGGRTGLRFLQESYAIGCSQLSKRGSSTGITPGSNTPATCASMGTDKGTSTLKRSARPSPSPSEDRDSPSSRATPSATLTTPRRAVPLGVREKKRRRLLWVEPEADPEVDRETGPADE